MANFADADTDRQSSITASNFGVVTLNSMQTVLVNATTDETSNGMIVGQFGLRVSSSMFDQSEHRSDTSSPPLTDESLELIATAAVERWASQDLSDELLAKLSTVDFRITDLPGSYVGLASPAVVWIDQDAAGVGWFVDTTPMANDEFSRDGTAVTSEARDRIDLLSVLMHELGHVMGFEHSEDDGDLMAATLDVGTRLRAWGDRVDDFFVEVVWD